VEAISTERRAVPHTFIASAFGVPVTELFRKARTKKAMPGRPTRRGKPSLSGLE